MSSVTAQRRASSRWLVTGASGQVGRSVLALAPEHAVEAHGFSHEELDIVDEAAVKQRLAEIEPDVLLNCAAFTSVDGCEEMVIEAQRGNSVGPEVLARVCGSATLLVHLSSDYVFDGSASQPIREDHPTRPLGMYGKTKLGGENAIRDAGGEHLIVRTQWLFGPGPNFIRTILGAAASQQELTVVDDQLGRPTWTAALARGLFEAVAAGVRGNLHLACEGVASWYDLAVDVVREGARRGLVPEVGVRPVPSSEMARPAPRPSYGVLGLEKARGLGIRMPHWADAVGHYLDAEKEGRDA